MSDSSQKDFWLESNKRFYGDVALPINCASHPLTLEQIVLRDRMIHAILIPFMACGYPLENLNEDGLDLFLQRVTEKCNEYGRFLQCIGNHCYNPICFLEDVIKVLRDRYCTNEDILDRLEDCIDIF